MSRHLEHVERGESARGTGGTSHVSDSRRWAALAVLVGAVLLLAIDGTVLYLAVPSLTRDLEPSATEVLWIGDVYSLALAGLLVTMGTLADRVGRKRLLLIGAAGFGAASTLAAFSTSPEMLIVSRVLLGVAGATIMPSTLSIIRHLFRDRVERTRAIAIWSAAAASGIALGPLVGGALLEHFWWGSVFLINVPVMVAILVFGVVLLPESKDPRPGRFDLVSSLLSMVAVVPLVVVVKRAADGDLGLVTLAAVAVGAVGTLAFVRRQRHSETPMIDVTLFANRAFSGAVVVNFLTIFALSGLLFFFSQYLQLVREFQPLLAGLAQLPVSVAAVMVAFVVGRALVRWGRGPAIAMALATAAGGLIALAVAVDAPSYVWVTAALVPVGLGVGLSETLSIDAVVGAVKPDKAGSAASISETAYELGVALGIAVLGSVVSLLYRAELDLSGDIPADTGERVQDSLASAVYVLDPESSVLATAREAFVAAMQTTTVVAAALLAVAAVAAWRWVPADRSAAPDDH